MSEHDYTSAFLFENGNVMILDEEGEQMTEYQSEGVAGLFEFKRDNPEAPVYMAEWNGGDIQPIAEL